MGDDREPDNTPERKAAHVRPRRMARPHRWPWPTYAAVTDKLGLTQEGLYKEMSGRRKVGGQTEIIIDQLEELQLLRSRMGRAEPLQGKRTRRRGDLAQYPCPKPRWPERE